ncbi:MAG: hypothetical protein JW838_11840 [Spirochaetes bacterium]|nr:hypothetical protein [Spirochaetota bacterium]
MKRFQSAVAILAGIACSVLLASCDDSGGDKTYGGKYDQQGYAVLALEDGGCVVAGESVASSGNPGDLLAMRLDSGGKVLWSRTTGGSGRDCAYDVKAAPGGGFIVAGVTESMGPGDPGNYGSYGNMMAVKIDGSGNIQWSRVYGHDLYESATGVAVTSDGGYLLGGYTHSYGSSRCIVVKIDAAGMMEWEGIYGTGDTTDVAYSVKTAPDGGYILAGSRIDGTGRAMGLLIRTDSLGGELWSSVYGETSRFNWIRDIDVGNDGSIVAAGYRGNDILPENQCDAWFFRVDPAGCILWERLFGGSYLDIAYAIKKDGDGYVISGETRSYGSGSEYSADLWVSRLDGGGNQVWSRTYGDGANDAGYDIDLLANGGYVVAGSTFAGLSNGYDVYVLKLDEDGNY